jgi:hypothetical protein
MAECGAVRAGRHCVFVIMYRHGVVTARHLERAEEIMRGVCADSGA